MLTGQPGPFQLWETDRHGWHVPSTAVWNCSTEMTVQPGHRSPHVFFRENGNSSVLMLLTTLAPLPDTATSRTMRGPESLGLLWGPYSSCSTKLSKTKQKPSEQPKSNHTINELAYMTLKTAARRELLASEMALSSSPGWRAPTYLLTCLIRPLLTSAHQMCPYLLRQGLAM